MVMWLASVAKEAHADVRTDLDLGGSLLLPLVLFILARVFRHGAAMREELEGTV
jgi:galactitol-specific phosphotransferase system IIC component